MEPAAETASSALRARLARGTVKPYAERIALESCSPTLSWPRLRQRFSTLSTFVVLTENRVITLGDLLFQLTYSAMAWSASTARSGVG